MEPTFYAAFLIGLLGSTHCVGMCGGIVGALNAGLPKSRQTLPSLAAHHVTYNSGRILSYAVAGAIAGFFGSQASRFGLHTVIPIGALIAGVVMIALGLYIAGLSHAITAIEKAGLHIWRRIQPLGQRFLPAETPARAFGLGLVWGWLPCGLVYSALVLAIVSASPAQGAWIMLGFGLGTLPMLFAMGGVAGQLMAIVRRPVTRRIVGASIILFGVYTCFTAFSVHGHHHASVDSATIGQEAGKGPVHSH